MKLTENILHRLEKLKGKMVLCAYHNYGSYCGARLMALYKWETAEHKPLIGKPYEKVIKLWLQDGECAANNEIFSKTSELEYMLKRLEHDRETFKNFMTDLEKFGYEIKAKV